MHSVSSETRTDSLALVLQPEREVFLVCKSSTCTIENAFEVEGNVDQLKGILCKEMRWVTFAIMKTKSVPKCLGLRFSCQMMRMDEWGTVTLESIVARRLRDPLAFWMSPGRSYAASASSLDNRYCGTMVPIAKES